MEETEYLPTNHNKPIGMKETMKFADEPISETLTLIEQLNGVFKFTLGQKVRNRHNEDGYIELCGLDYRGIIYLVHMPGNHHTWYTEFELKPINYGNSEQDANLKSDQKIKTDIPQP